MQLVHDWLVMNSFTIIENCLLVKDITLYTYMYMYMYMCSDKEKILLQEQKIMWTFFFYLLQLLFDITFGSISISLPGNLILLLLLEKRYQKTNTWYK